MISNQTVSERVESLPLEQLGGTGSAEPPAEGLLDLSILRQLEEDAAPFPVAEVIEIFIEEAEKHRQVITSALLAKDIDTLRREAHSVKGSAATFGTERLRSAASRAEVCCAEKSAEQALEAAGPLPAMIDASVRALACHFGLGQR